MNWQARRVQMIGLGIAIGCAALVSLLAWQLHAAPNDPPAVAPAPVAPVPTAAAAPATAATAATTTTATTPPNSPNVTIAITVVPPHAASVYWGKARIGLIKPRGALVVQRPRDSGPLDLIIRADGCLPVHTRAYTFNDNRISVRLTTEDQKTTLLGYREELPPPDAGAPSMEATFEAMP